MARKKVAGARGARDGAARPWDSGARASRTAPPAPRTPRRPPRAPRHIPARLPPNLFSRDSTTRRHRRRLRAQCYFYCLLPSLC